MLRRTLITGLLLATGAFAQLSSFPKPSYFRETFNKTNTKVELQPPVRLKDFIATGDGCVQPETIKLPEKAKEPEGAGTLGLGGADAATAAEATAVQMTTPDGQPVDTTVPPPAPPAAVPARCLRLGLKDFIDLVAANNTDIQISYLSIETAKNAVTSRYGAWDPKASFGFTPSLSYSDSAKSNPFPTTSQTKRFPLTFSFSQTLPTGQSISANGGGSKSGSWGGNSSYSSNMGFSVTQPLLQNRGSYINKISLYQAQSSLKTSQFSLMNSLITSVANAESAYWTVVSAREQLFVAQYSREVQRQLLDYSVRQFKLGGISYLALYRPRQSMASAEVNVSNAEFSLRRAVDALRKQMAADLDPAIRDLPIVLADSPELSAAEAIVPDREQAVQSALANHPTIKRVLENLNADDLTLTSAKNGLMPSLNLTASYAGSGLGNTYTGGFGSGYSGPPIYGGLGDALSQMFGWGNPGYTLNLSLNLPIRSRSASMTMANALITKKNDTLNLRTQQQSIRLNVLNAITSLQGSLEALKLAQVAASFAQLDYDAQNLMYKLGTNQQIDVITSASSLTGSLQSVVTAQINLRNSLLNLYQQSGELLDRRSIVVKTTP